MTAEYAWDEPMSAHRLRARVVLEAATEAFRGQTAHEQWVSRLLGLSSLVAFNLLYAAFLIWAVHALQQVLTAQEHPLQSACC